MKPEALIRLTKVFKQNNWDLSHEDISYAYGCIAALFEILTIEEESLLLEMLEQYKIIPFQQYLGAIVEQIEKIPVDIIQNAQRILLFPFPEDGIQIAANSSSFVHYLLRKPSLAIKKHFNNKPLLWFEKFIPGTYQAEDLIVLTDDFIGSGSQAGKALQSVIDFYQVPFSKVVICTIACQEEGFQALSMKSLVFSGNIRKKGISGYFQSPLKEEKLNVMKNLERKLKISKRYSLGFKQSEALITMHNTPNNTFPIFWHNFFVAEKNLSPPFPRNYEN